MEALYPIGVRAEVTKLEKNTAINGYKITLDIGQRVQALQLEEEDGMLMMRVFPIYDDYSSEAAKALTQKTEARLQTELLRFNRLTRKLSSAQLTMIQNQTDIAKKIDIMTHLVVSQMENRYAVLSNVYIDQRMEKLLTFLVQENELIHLEMTLNQRVKAAIDKSQKEYFLREKIKVIRKELGEEVDKDAELDELEQKIEASLMPETVKERARKELKRMRNSRRCIRNTATSRTIWISSWGCVGHLQGKRSRSGLRCENSRKGSLWSGKDQSAHSGIPRCAVQAR